MADAGLTAYPNTPDADLYNAPYKISQKATKDTATIYFDGSVGVTLRWWMLRRGGTSAFSGTRMREQGAMCGVTRCGVTRPLNIAPTAPTPFRAKQTITVTFAQVNDGGADGPRTLKLYGAT